VLEHGPGVPSDVKLADRRQPDLDESRACHVGARVALLADEAVIGQHRQQPVGGRMRDAEMLARLGQPDPRLAAEQHQQAQRVVHRRDRVSRFLAGLAFLHSRNLTGARPSRPR
jgi:hypothetical protein